MVSPTADTPAHLIATCERCQSRVSLEPFIADVRRMIEFCNFDQERVTLRSVLIALLHGDLESICEAIYEVDDFANVFSDAGCDLPVFLGITS